MDPLDYIWMGILAVFQGPAMFEVFGITVPITLVMVFFGLLTGVLVGSTPGLAGPMAMAVALPILISVFGFNEDALLPVMGFLIGIMKGATIGGAVPAILFNTPGTPTERPPTTALIQEILLPFLSRNISAVANLGAVSLPSNVVKFFFFWKSE